MCVIIINFFIVNFKIVIILINNSANYLHHLNMKKYDTFTFIYGPFHIFNRFLKHALYV